MRHLLTDNDEDPAAQRKHIQPGDRRSTGRCWPAAWSSGWPSPTQNGRSVRLTVDLQADFALNQPLSPLALAAIELLDRESPEYPLDVLSVIEATLDNPRQVLSAQLFRARGEAVAAMKAEGIEYEERMELLEAVTYPRPQADLLEAAYNIYRQGHPWVADHELAPKSVARDMFERAMTFTEYVSLLRPDPVRGPGAALPGRRLQGAAPDRARGGPDRGAHRPDRVARRAGPPGGLQPDRRVGAAAQPGRGGRASRSTRRRRRSPATSARSGCWSATRCSGGSSWPRCGAGTSSASWTPAPAGTPRPGRRRWSRTSTSTARSAPGRTRAGRRLLILEEEPREWTARQIFDDPAGDHDWGFSATVDLAACDEAGDAVLTVTEVGQL